MNTIRSVGYGWGVLIVAGAGSYYFAKKSINSDREERAMAEEKRRQQRERMRAQESVSREMAMGGGGGLASGSSDVKSRTRTDHPSPSVEGANDPAPVTHQEPVKGKYEASEPYRSRKGDRFS